MKNDIQIASEATIKPIGEIAEKLGLSSDQYDNYGKHIAKIDPDAGSDKPADAKMVLVTAMTPTPAGEGKTTVSVGLNEALNKIGKKSVVTLREASLGPVFGVKGGATGGGYSQVLPMAEINLHFTGDIHAVGTAHNLLAAVTDNHYTRANRPCLLPKHILWNRVVDMNDRSLRDIVVGLGDTAGQIRQSKFEITAASEIMAILGLVNDVCDLRQKLGDIIVAESQDGTPITARELKAQGAMAILLKDAMKPNLVQTLEGNPAIIHTGPFANIAHGTNSILANIVARRFADIVVTEAGFGSDLGAEKFFNLVSRQQGMVPPDAVVIVATIRALKYHGGVKKKQLTTPDADAVKKGFANLEKHIENMKSFNRPVFVALNSFAGDTEQETATLLDLVRQSGTPVFLTDVWGKGGDGAIELAQAVWNASHEENGKVNYTYNLDEPVDEKIRKVATKIYGADNVLIPRKVLKKIEKLKDWGYSNFPICIAKTQSSLSDTPSLTGRPSNFNVEIRDVKVSAGAGFIIVYTSDIMTMPGLPLHPASEEMDINRKGEIKGLF